MRSKLSPSRSSSSSKVMGLWREMSMPISCMTATAKGSSSPFCTPAEPTYIVAPNICLSSPAAIGERTAFMPHANNTAWGREGRSDAAIRSSTFPVQYADQREQPPRSIEIDRHFSLQTLHQDLRAVIVDGATAHIDC